MLSFGVRLLLLHLRNRWDYRTPPTEDLTHQETGPCSFRRNIAKLAETDMFSRCFSRSGSTKILPNSTEKNTVSDTVLALDLRGSKPCPSKALSRCSRLQMSVRRHPQAMVT